MAQGNAPTPPPEDLRPARLEARIVAAAVDALVLLALLPPFIALAGLTVLLQTDWLADDPSGREWIWGYLVGGLWLLVPILYFTLAALHSDTLGARLLGLTVRATTGRRPSPRAALARSTLLLLGLLALGLCFIGATFDGRRRTIGDRLTATVVVEAPARGARA